MADTTLLTAQVHRRRQIIFGLVLAIAIPLVNTLLQKWGLPPLPNLTPATASPSSEPAKLSSDGGSSCSDPSQLLTAAYDSCNESATAPTERHRLTITKRNKVLRLFTYIRNHRARRFNNANHAPAPCRGQPQPPCEELVRW